MSQIELSEKSEVSIPTIQRVENDEEKASVANRATMNRLRKALEDAGLKFINSTDETGNGAGVRLWIENKKSDNK